MTVWKPGLWGGCGRGIRVVICSPRPAPTQHEVAGGEIFGDVHLRAQHPYQVYHTLCSC